MTVLTGAAGRRNWRPISHMYVCWRIGGRELGPNVYYILFRWGNDHIQHATGCPCHVEVDKSRTQ